MGDHLHRLEIGLQAIQLWPYRTGLAARHLRTPPEATALQACYCPLGLSPPGKPLTQERSSEFLTAAPGIRRSASRRTPDVILSNHRAQAPTTARDVIPNGVSRTRVPMPVGENIRRIGDIATHLWRDGDDAARRNTHATWERKGLRPRGRGRASGLAGSPPRIGGLPASYHRHPFRFP
jgi:hypothetical protein